MRRELIDYCLSQEGLILLPIEALGPGGMRPELREALLAREAMSAPIADAFDAAYALYWERCRDLNARAPRYWFPPRHQHVCLVTRPDQVRPYFQPLRRNSWLLYVSDFDPERSSTELAVFQLLLVERMGLLGQVVPALTANLSYLLTLDEAQRQDLASGCERCARPDAAGFRALAKALPWIGRLTHESLHPPKLSQPGARMMPHTGLWLTAEVPARLDALERAWSRAAQNAFERHRAAFAGPSPPGAAQICDWLAEARPSLLVTKGDGQILWDPEAPEANDALREALAAVTTTGAANILADLELVDYHSRRFLDSLVEPEALVDPAPYITAGGLSYIHKTRKLIGYSLGPGENEERLWQPSPPFERLMLAARTIHEWGHLAAESGWVGVPPERRAEREALEPELSSLFEAIHAATPPAIRARAAREVAELRAKGELGSRLLASMLVRIEDYMANLLARRFLHPDEMDTYVRNNVSSHVQDYSEGAVYQQLTRYAYEYQYLRLSRIEDPLAWFYASTWFAERFIDRGIVSLEMFEQLLATIGRICDCYAIDASKFDFEGLGEVRDPKALGTVAKTLERLE